MAIAAAAPTARVSVATAMITNIRNAVSTHLVEERAADADARHGGAELRRLVGPDGEEHERAGGGAGELRGDVGERVARREVARRA